jgi:Raf kinase inhibitor-like YbhB/YbcL family protein
MSVMQEAKALIGHMLRHVRSSNEKLASAKTDATSQADISVTSDDFQNGMPIPTQFTQYGANISPSLKWSGVPSNAKELVLVLEDPDAPRPNPIVHWVVYQIPPTSTGLSRGDGSDKEARSAIKAKHASNYNHKEAYDGPKPPPGHGVHHYHFQLFALDAPLDLRGEPERDDLVKAMQGHVIAQGELVGTYEKTT